MAVRRFCRSRMAGVPPGAGALERKRMEPQRASVEMSLGLAPQDDVSQHVPLGLLAASGNMLERFIKSPGSWH